MHQPAILWIDSKTAKIFEFAGDEIQHRVVHREEQAGHHDPDAASVAHHEDHFYHQVAGHLLTTNALLVIGPSVAKDRFVHHLERHHHPDLARKVVAVESADHPTDPQLLAYARKYFTEHQVMP